VALGDAGAPIVLNEPFVPVAVALGEDVPV
jgi:hypothetical protein